MRRVRPDGSACGDVAGKLGRMQRAPTLAWGTISTPSASTKLPLALLLRRTSSVPLEIEKRSQLEPADAAVAPLVPAALSLGHQDRLVDGSACPGSCLPSYTVNGAALE